MILNIPLSMSTNDLALITRYLDSIKSAYVIEYINK